MRKSVNLFYDMNESFISYEVSDLIFYFSSDFNKERFINQYREYIKNENYKLKCKYNVNINFDKMLLISFYKKIEKRGYKVLNKQNDLKIVNSYDIIYSKVGE